MTEKVHVTTIVKHGMYFFKSLGVKCPECDSEELLNPNYVDPNRYWLKCAECGCEFMVEYRTEEEINETSKL